MIPTIKETKTATRSPGSIFRLPNGQELPTSHRYPLDPGVCPRPRRADKYDGLDQELAKDVAGAGATAIAARLRVRSVTLTSMMFMMPTPPTINEITATIKSSVPMVAVMDSSRW